MTANIDFSSVFETALPNVYIKRVHLLPATAVGRRAGHHFDEEKLYQFQKNIYGKKTIVAQAERVDAVSDDPRNLMVNVELVIKDRYLSTGRPSWFDNEEALKFLKLRVLLCKNASLSDDLLKRRCTPKYLKKFRQTNDFQERIIDIRKNMHSSLRQQKKEIIDGKKAYSITYIATFNIDNYNPKHLTVLANTFVDLNEYSLTKRRSSQSSRGFLQGNTVAETVINNSTINDSAYVYTLPDGKVWTGPIHYHKDGGYMAGAFHSAEKHSALNRKRVANLVVEDHRLLDDALKAEPLLRPSNPTYGVELRENKSSENIKIIRADSYITEPYCASTPNNEVKFAFHIDFEKSIRENTQYGAIMEFSDPSAKAEILSGCRIKNIRVFRHRVVGGLQRGEVREVEYEEKTELVAHSSETNAGNLPTRTVTKSYQPDSVESEKVVVGAIRELNMTANGMEGIRTFGVTDYSMINKTNGLYRYSVEIEVEDGTVAFTRAQMNKLESARKGLEEYYNRASLKENLDPLTGQFSHDFIESMSQEYSVPTESSILANNRSDRAALVNSSIASSPWLKASATYLDVLFNLTSISNDSITRLARLLQQVCDPSTGTISGVETTIELMQSLEEKVQSKLGASLPSIDQIDYGMRTSAYKGKMPRNSFTLLKYFKKTHDSDILKKVGYNFLSGDRQTVGPRSVTTEEYRNRLDLENQKFFNTSYSNMLEVTPTELGTQGSRFYTTQVDLQDRYFSYLTPASIELGNKTLKTTDRGPGLWDTRQYNRMISAILASSSRFAAPAGSLASKSDPRDPAYAPVSIIDYGGNYNEGSSKVTKEVFANNVANTVVLAGFNISINSKRTQKLMERRQKSREGVEPEQTDLVSATAVVGSSSDFVAAPVEVEEVAISEDAVAVGIEELEDLSDLSEIFISATLRAKKCVFSGKNNIESIEQLSSKNSENIIDEKFGAMANGDDRKKEFLRKLPNQIKSIFLGDLGLANKDWFAERLDGRDLFLSSKYSGLLYFNYQHINAIEVLVGFERDNTGRLLISSPKWNIMTKAIFEEIEKNKTTALCRMVPFGDSILGLKKNPKLTLPEFDQVFLIGPRSPGDPADINGATTDLYVSRLVEYASLNEAGTQALSDMVNSTVLQEQIPPEFVSTAFVQQPYTVSRVGTRFSSDTEPRASSPDSSRASTALRTNGISRSQTSTMIGGGY